ncbi:hypothetical protein K488DRAFT_52013 [Vararia minispora EC-137]|uniref:Uncharacterized protein n=1 Tax=Vararia minispora EC-137 TaxID=1314806 RepID=A0ACB8QIN2_9AGAM|nr:hypothetical protein K488DRAFT_52013 [Vararia minispora EC-137]
MASALATQLAQGASLNSGLLLERTRRKPTESYLFTGQDANQHDLESLQALGLNAFIQLRQLNSSLSPFEDAFFSDASKHVDRTLLPGDEGRDLDGKVRAFLPMLGKNLMEIPTGRVLEWMVRRFRVHEFNVEDVLALFLPYHESPHFAKMVTILHIPPSSTWSFLNAHKSAAQSVQRQALVSEMLRSVDVTRFVASLLPSAAKAGHAHRTLVSFHTGVLLDFISRSKAMDANNSAILLPSIIESMKAVSGKSENVALSKDIILSGYLLLAAFSQKCHLTAQAVSAILSSMASGANKVAPQQFITAVLSVVNPQDILSSLPALVIKRMLAFKDLPQLLEQTFEWTGSEKLLQPLTSGLVMSTQEETSDALKSLLMSSKTPLDVLRHAIEQLLKDSLKDTPSAHTRDLLLVIYQRHQELLDQIAQGFIKEDETKQDALEELLFGLSMKPSGKTKDIDAVVASMDASVTIRVGAVADLYKRLSKPSKLGPSEAESIGAALLARIRDPQRSVVEALYAKPGMLAPLALDDLQTYTAVLLDALPKCEKVVLRLHLDFLLRHVGARSSPEASRELFEMVLFPCLLFSRDRQTGHIASELLADVSNSSTSGLTRYELLDGYVETLESVREGSKVPSAKMNIAVASRMAGAVLMSDNRENHVSFLLERTSGLDPHARALAHLVLRALFGQMPSEEQVAVGRRILDTVSVKSLQSLEDLGDDVISGLSDDALGKIVSSKPMRPSTLAWLQVSFLSSLATIVRPPGSLTMIQQVRHPMPIFPFAKSDSPGSHYVRLLRAVYALMNAAQLPSALMTHTLRSLFSSLGKDTLAFLAGTWLLNDQTEPLHGRLRHTSLAHAYAFLAAHEYTDHTVDFQTIVPALLVALQDNDALVRQAAAHCVAALDKVCQASQVSAVYAFDTVYGEASKELQYLDWEDVQRYVGWLCAERLHFVNDALAVRVYHRNALSQSDSKKIKKKLAYQQRVLCFILSHALACGIPSTKISLICLVQGVSSPLKARTLLTTLLDLGAQDRFEALKPIFGGRTDEFAALIVDVIDGSSVADLKNPSGQLWEAYIGLVRFLCRDGAPQTPKDKLLQNMHSEIIDELSPERTFELARVLLSLASGEAEMTMLRSVLEKITQNVQLVIRLLTALQPAVADAAQRASKRAKIDAHQGQDASPSFTELSTLAEVLSNAPLLGSLELVTALLETLSKVIHTEVMTRSESLYIQQRLMAAVERSASKITVSITTSLRLDVLVDIIRLSDSPQTSNQALLLLSTLAKLSPDTVLHNVMPVFTFMGSNVFHRDDSYSFRVIQKTVDSIIPVMVSSLSDKRHEHLDLLLGARDLVRVFTDAANHIPRHRRTQFFIHFIDVLGSDTFLGLVCMLLIGKHTNRIVRQQGEDLRSTLNLALSLVQHYPAATQLHAMRDLLEEAQRLLAHAVGPQEEHRVVLDVTHDDEQNTQATALLRRRAQAIVVFAGHVADQTPTIFSDSTVPKNAVDQLLANLLGLVQSSEAQQDVKDVRAAGRVALMHYLRAMPAVQFVASIATILEVPKPSVQLEAVKLLADRITLVVDYARKAASANIIKIVQQLNGLLSSPVQDLTGPVLLAIRALSSSAVEGEENTFMGTVPLIIAELRDRQNTEEAVAALVPLSVKLGPRIIPFFHDLLREIVALLRESLEATSDATKDISNNALDVLRALFSNVPGFWGGSELTAIFLLYLDSRSSLHIGESLRTFVRSIAKKASSQVLFPAVFDVWPALENVEANHADQLEAYFELLRRVLHAATRPVALENTRPVFKLVLDGLDARRRLPDVSIPRVENTVIAAFVELVTKLNETVFRPLFRRLFDWAFGNDAAEERKIAFLNTYRVLLDFFKSLMTPYLSVVLPPLLSLLQQLAEAQEIDEELWAAALDMLSKSLVVDEGGANELVFWREDKLSQVIPALVLQTPLASTLSLEPFAHALDALVSTLSDDAQLKSFNLSLLMHTRDEEARVRLGALRAAAKLWDVHGDKLMGFSGETATFIAECAEDENDEVVRATRVLKEAVERASGERFDTL